MGKQGPCHHCGVTSTPLWRNGPPEKPVLCNACGSRWRTKGSLLNYTPHHARDEIEIKDQRVQKIPKRKKPYQENFTVNNSFKKKALDEEGSNKSSSGSVLSNSESCDQWETNFLCKKRTYLSRPKAAVAAASVEKLTKDLYSILQEEQSFWCFSEEDLLFESETPVLIGHGSVLMTDAQDEESEASNKSSSKATKQEQF